MRIMLALIVSLSMMPQKVIADRPPFYFLQPGKVINEAVVPHVADRDRELIVEISTIICQHIGCEGVPLITVVSDPAGNSVCQVASNAIASRVFEWPVDPGSHLQDKIGCLVYLLTKEVFKESVPERCNNPHYADRVAIGAEILKDIADNATLPTASIKNDLIRLSDRLDRVCAF